MSDQPIPDDGVVLVRSRRLHTAERRIGLVHPWIIQVGPEELALTDDEFAATWEPVGQPDPPAPASPLPSPPDLAEKLAAAERDRRSWEEASRRNHERALGAESRAEAAEAALAAERKRVGDAWSAYDEAIDDTNDFKARVAELEEALRGLCSEAIALGARLVRLCSPDGLPQKWGELIDREAVVQIAMCLRDDSDRARAALSAPAATPEREEPAR